MRYFVSLDPKASGNPSVVDLRELPAGGLGVTVDDAAVAADVVWLDGVASVRVSGKIIDLVLDGAPPDLYAVANGRRCQVKVESDRSRAAAAAAARGGAAGGSDKVVKAPMPGRVVRVLVAAGDTLEAGATLCVIEAMKMENEVKTKAACKVVEVRAAEGAAVEAGSKLFVLG